MNFMTLKQIMLKTKQSILAILELEQQYREAMKKAKLEELKLQKMLEETKDED